MCGICGIFSGAGVDGTTLERMNRTLLRRGPDEGGEFVGNSVGLAMRRLSIIDISGGRQPIFNEDKSVCVVFNGELYNYQELRKSLIARGHRFATNSDTEVLVHLYEDFGDSLVDHLRGMFAFALWDSSLRRGVIARDRLGIKPMFYAEVGDTLVFGSEIKAVLASDKVRKSIDYQGLDAYFTYTYIPAPLTIYRDVRKLSPGYLMVWEDGKTAKRQYWDVDFSHEDDLLSARDWANSFDSAIQDAVTSHMVSDVPVGAFLSGGVDSSLIVAMMSQHANDPVQTFTMGFDRTGNSIIDERPLAKKVALRYGCRYYESVVQPDFCDIVEDIAAAFDEPFADDSVIPSYYVSQFARQNVKVAMSGLGGDELFAGYQRYSGMLLSEHYSKLIPAGLHRGLIQPFVKRIREPGRGGDRVDHAKRFAESVLKSPSERYLGFVSTLSAGGRRSLFSKDIRDRIDYGATARIVKDPFEQCGAPDDVTRALYADIKTYLPEDILALSDRLSMWHSLEVRVPLVDHKLVELSASLPVKYKISLWCKKILFKEIASRWLPSEIIDHRKQGFEAPMAAWLRSDLKNYARDVLSARRLGGGSMFDSAFVGKALDDHVGGRRRHNKLLFSLLMFQTWFEREMA